MVWVFDDISRTVARRGESRRHVFKIIAGALAGAAFTPLGRRRAQDECEFPEEPTACGCLNLSFDYCCEPRFGGPRPCSIGTECCSTGCCDPDTQQCDPQGFSCEPRNAIELSSFTAEAHANGTVILEWETATEVNNAGFNLYRARIRGGPYIKINDALISAEGATVAGASYRFVDRPGSGIFRYMLEDVDYYGVNTLHGPIRAR